MYINCLYLFLLGTPGLSPGSHEQNLIFADGRILNLECDGKGFWLYNKTPTGAEIEYWQKRPESCYLLTAKGSHDVGTAMPIADVVRVNRLQWTNPKLVEWQQRFCYHSETAIKKTFENTTQYYKAVPMENQLFPTHSFERRFPGLRVKRIKEHVFTDTLEFKAPKRKGSGGNKFVGQLFVCSKSKFVKLYRLASPNPRQKVPVTVPFCGTKHRHP